MMTTAWISLLISGILFFQPQASAQSFQRLKIVYGSPSWNTQNKRADSAFIFLRNKQTGQVVKVVLEESDPDSSNFVGDFSLQLKDSKELSQYEAYIPPQNMRSSDEASQKFNQLLSKNQVEKKPIVIREKNGRVSFEVFDTKNQAERAEKLYTAEKETAEKAKDKAVESETLIVHMKQEKEAAEREANRLRLEQIEKQIILNRQQQVDKLNEAQRSARIEQAKKLADDAMKDYQAGRFSIAEEKFRKSAELDPHNSSFYYQYGVTLYKNNKADKALVVFSAAKVEPALESEKKFYTALCHYKLKELSAAEPLFLDLSKSEDSVIAPASHFYRGTILFEQEKFDDSKASFETVIDTSDDPQMAKRAEEMLEQIIQAQQFKALQSKRWSLNFTAGAMYDSNVLLAQDNQTSQGAALRIGDTRFLIAAAIENRAVVRKNWEWAPKFTTFYMYSIKSKAAVADPLVANIYLPINWKNLFLDKSSQWQIGPGYETLFMDANANGERENIMNSVYINGKQNMLIRPDWMSSHELEARQDTSLLADSTGDNDYSAMKYLGRITEIFFLNSNRSEMIMPTMAYTMNDAKGKNRYYTRFEIGSAYVRPVKWVGSWISSLTFYQLHYSKSTPTRTDTNVTLSTGFSKPWIGANWGMTATYSSNTSDNETYHYSKYTILGTVGWNNAF